MATPNTIIVTPIPGIDNPAQGHNPCASSLIPPDMIEPTYLSPSMTYFDTANFRRPRRASQKQRKAARDLGRKRKGKSRDKWKGLALGAAGVGAAAVGGTMLLSQLQRQKKDKQSAASPAPQAQQNSRTPTASQPDSRASGYMGLSKQERKRGIEERVNAINAARRDKKYADLPPDLSNSELREISARSDPKKQTEAPRVEGYLGLSPERRKKAREARLQLIFGDSEVEATSTTGGGAAPDGSSPWSFGNASMGDLRHQYANEKRNPKERQKFEQVGQDAVSKEYGKIPEGETVEDFKGHKRANRARLKYIRQLAAQERGRRGLRDVNNTIRRDAGWVKPSDFWANLRLNHFKQRRATWDFRSPSSQIRLSRITASRVNAQDYRYNAYLQLTAFRRRQFRGVYFN